MKKFTGKGVYGAIAMGKISVFQKQDTLIQRTSVKVHAQTLGQNYGTTQYGA